MNKNRWSACLRAVRCAVLLALLAVCGAIGSGGEQAQSVSVPVTAVTVSLETAGAVTVKEARSRLYRQRMDELAILSEVIESDQADARTRSAALDQKTQIAGFMETEAQAEAALAYMGFGEAAAVCGARSVTVFAPYAYMKDESARVKIIDCVCTQTGLSPESVKIILAKNE